MNGVRLDIYMEEFARHHHLALYEWLLEHARKNGIKGGTAFKAIGGFGRYHVLREHFYELGSNVPILVQFVVSEAEADGLLKMLEEEHLHVFYTRTPVEFGVLN